MKGLIELFLQAKGKRIIVKVPRKYCTLKTKIGNNKRMSVNTGGQGSPEDERYAYDVDITKTVQAGYDCVIKLFGGAEDCDIMAIPNQVDDSFGVIVVDEISNDEILDWANGKEIVRKK